MDKLPLAVRNSLELFKKSQCDDKANFVFASLTGFLGYLIALQDAKLIDEDERSDLGNWLWDTEFSRKLYGTDFSKKIYGRE